MDEKELEAIKAMNIYQRIGAVSYEIGRVQMSLNVDTGQGKSYKAISINDVVDALIPLIGKYRLVILPGEKELRTEEQIETSYKNGGKKTNFFVRMKSTYKVVNIDNPAEFVEAVGYGDGIDSGDKATGKALTYGRKYALIDLFNLSKGDDPDKEASEEGFTQPVYNQSQMAVEFSTLTRELLNIGVNFRDETVAKFIMDTAKVNTIDSGMLLTDLPGMARVIAVMKGILNKKKQ